MTWILGLIWVGALGGCSGADSSAYAIQSQHWQDMEVRVESRPTPPREGMNEFLVMLTGAHGEPKWDCLVYLRGSDADPWKQAIQDGRVAVYRRAVALAGGPGSLLQVRIEHDGAQSVLRFPIRLH